MYDIHSFYEAESIEDAVNALMDNPNAVLISGGSDVLIQIREGRHGGKDLISIHGISELKGIHMEADGAIVIGGGTTFSNIANHPDVLQWIPVLGEAVDQIGGPQIRNIGTIGGNVCNGVTSADSAAALLILNAKLELIGKSGSRMVAIKDFYVGAGKTVRTHDEILKNIRIEKEDYIEFHAHYRKFGKRNAMEIATLGCAVGVRLSKDKTLIEDLRVGYGVAAPTPIRCYEIESKLKGQPVTEATMALLGKGVLLEVHPRTSWRASKEFRLQLIEELAKRTFVQAVKHGGGAFCV